MPEGSLKDKLCIVTGGSSGIGRATVEALCRKEAKVVIADIDDALAGEAAKQFGCTFTHCDVSSEPSVEEAVRAAMDEHNRPLHVYVNCAGVQGALGHICDMDAAGFDATQAINLRGTFLGIKHAARAMREHAVEGAIVNVASIASVDGGYAPAAYTASKWAVVGLTKQAACELAPLGIRCNVVSPTGVDTPMLRRALHKGVNESTDEDMRQLQSFPHVCTVEDIAASVVFLASGDAASITGHNLVVDCALSTCIAGMTMEAFAQMRGAKYTSFGPKK